MNTITIPPEALDAAKRAANEYLTTDKNHTEEKLFTAAIRAALAAWPGRDTCTKITPDPATQQWIIPQKCLRLPLKETSDE